MIPISLSGVSSNMLNQGTPCHLTLGSFQENLHSSYIYIYIQDLTSIENINSWNTNIYHVISSGG